MSLGKKECYIIKRIDAGSGVWYINEGFRLYTSDLSEAKKFESENDAMMFIDRCGIVGSFCIMNIIELTN